MADDLLLYNVGTSDEFGVRRWHGSYRTDAILRAIGERPMLGAQLAFLASMPSNGGKYPEFAGGLSPNAAYRTARRTLDLLAKMGVESLPTKSGEPWPPVPEDY